MMQRPGILAVAALTAASPVDAGSPLSGEAPDTAVARALEEILDAAVEEGFAGGVAVLRRGEVVYARVAGHSDPAGTVPVTPATLFHVASITKYLTAILVLEAEQERKLSLDDPVTQHLRDLPPSFAGVSIGDLLAHRSGLGSSYAAESAHDPQAAVAAIAAAPRDPDRAGTFRYSNDGYDLLAVILERLHGLSYETIARRDVLRPAGLTGAGFWGETDLGDPAAVGQPLRPLPERLRRRNYGMLGSAGFLITALDLARLEAAVDGGLLLDPRSVDTLRAARTEVSIGRATYGAFLLADEVLGPCLSARGLEDWGDNAILNHYLDEDLIVAVVTSKGPLEGRGAPFRDRISRAIADILKRRE
jgi:CubicO group peptidase (beta-lactamase class C family)